ncbi:hypothetical protein H4R33_005748 [Dimargaris cristalligena]|nr:hypothetical protein H4R33_005748 [Dimargaris cristalligena]
MAQQSSLPAVKERKKRRWDVVAPAIENPPSPKVAKTNVPPATESSYSPAGNSHLSAFDKLMATSLDTIKSGPALDSPKASSTFSTARSRYIQEKVFIGINKPEREFNLKGRIMGPNGAFINHIQDKTKAKIILRGRGSGYIEPTSGTEAFEAMYLYITCYSPEGIRTAKDLCTDLIKTVTKEYDAFQAAKKQSTGALAQATAQPPANPYNYGGYPPPPPSASAYPPYPYPPPTSATAGSGAANPYGYGGYDYSYGYGYGYPYGGYPPPPPPPPPGHSTTLAPSTPGSVAASTHGMASAYSNPYYYPYGPPAVGASDPAVAPLITTGMVTPTASTAATTPAGSTIAASGQAADSDSSDSDSEPSSTAHSGSHYQSPQVSSAYSAVTNTSVPNRLTVRPTAPPPHSAMGKGKYSSVPPPNFKGKRV